MSHIVSIATKVRDPQTIAAACVRLKLPAPIHGTTELFSGAATGVIVHLPAWQYPIVIDTAQGTIKYDNYNGAWGEEQELDRFLQIYAVEVAKLEARRKGFQVHEQPLNDGSIKLQILEGS